MANLGLFDTPLVRALRSLSSDELDAELEQIKEQRLALDAHEQLVRLAQQMRNFSAHKAENGTRQHIEAFKGPGNFRSKRRSNGTPSTRAAILSVLTEREGIWTKDEIMARLDQQGWLPSGGHARQQVTSRLGEMVKRGEVVRHGEARYSLVPVETPQATLLGAERAE